MTDLLISMKVASLSTMKIPTAVCQ